MIENGSPSAATGRDGPRVVVVVGNPKARSRTRAVAELVGTQVVAATAGTSVGTVDLADYADEMFSWPGTGLAVISERVATADIVVVASPVYKGSYTGLMKSFLDRYQFASLTGVVAIPVMTGSDPRHALSPDYTLSPLLAELGASLPVRGFFFDIAAIDTAASVIETWAETHLSALCCPFTYSYGATR